MQIVKKDQITAKFIQNETEIESLAEIEGLIIGSLMREGGATIK